MQDRVLRGRGRVLSESTTNAVLSLPSVHCSFLSVIPTCNLIMTAMTVLFSTFSEIMPFDIALKFGV